MAEETSGASKPLTQKANLGIVIGVDEEGFAVDLGELNGQKKGKPVQDTDRVEKMSHFMWRTRMWRTPQLARMAPSSADDATENGEAGHVPGKDGLAKNAGPHTRTTTEMEPLVVERARERGRALRDRVFPRQHADSKKCSNDEGTTHGDYLGVHGSLGDLEGKFEPNFVLRLGKIDGSVSGKTGLGDHLTHGVTNIIGNTTGVEGSGNGFLTPIDVTGWGDREAIDLLLMGLAILQPDQNGGSDRREESTLVLKDGFIPVKDLDREQKEKLITGDPRPGSFWQLYKAAETAYLDDESGGYDRKVRDLYDKAWAELDRVWVIVKQLKLVSHLDKVTVADPSLATDVTEERLRQEYQRLFQLAVDSGKADPTSGPFDVLRHTNEEKSVAGIVARYLECDGRSPEQKEFRLPMDPVINTLSDEVFWRNWVRRENRRRRNINKKLMRKPQRRFRRGKYQNQSLLPMVEIPTVPKWVGKRLFLTPIIPFPEQPDRLILDPKESSETVEEFHARLFRSTGQAWRHYVEMGGFLFSVPEFEGTGKIEILSRPPKPPYNDRGLSGEELDGLLRMTPATREQLLRDRVYKQPEPSAAIYVELSRLMKPLPPEKKEVQLVPEIKDKETAAPRDSWLRRNILDRPLFPV